VAQDTTSTWPQPSVFAADAPETAVSDPVATSTRPPEEPLVGEDSSRITAWMRPAGRPVTGSTATGVWTSAVFIGQFICPLVVLGLSDAISGLGSALLTLGLVALVAAVGVRAIWPTQAADPTLAAH
jgi:hypothetical protein